MTIKKFIKSMTEADKVLCHEEFLEYERSGLVKDDAILRKYVEEYIQKHMGGEGSFAIVCTFIMFEIYKESYSNPF